MNHVADIDGPWRFALVRSVDETGVSGTGHVADGVRFLDGTCVIRWRTKTSSTAVYASLAELEQIHGHGGATRVEPIDTMPTEEFWRGHNDCYQDRCEGCHFASIGGPVARRLPQVPERITEDRDEWLRGYLACAEKLYGSDWKWTNSHDGPDLS